MNKKEQLFATKLKNYLLATKPEYSMAVEVKITEYKTFNFNEIRQSQWATLLKLHEGIPVAHKISDGKMNSKLVDLLYLNPDAVRIIPYVAVKFAKSSRCYLINFDYIKKCRNSKSISVYENSIDKYLINWKL